VEVVKEGDRLERIREVTAAPAMVAQDTPVLEASNRVLDSGSTPTMSTPRSVAQDPRPAKHRRDEFGAAISAVGKDATMLLADCLDVRAAVVHRSLRLPGPPAVVAAIRRSRQMIRTCAVDDQR
jgi:hypothetical protein